MAIYDFFLSRNNAASTPENYVGHEGRLFYNSETGELRLSDGVTPGGLPIPITAATATTLGSITPGNGLRVTSPGVLSVKASSSFSFDGNQFFKLNAATTAILGGIKAGPGVVIASDGTLSLDSSGIPFNFGDFYATTPLNGSATLSSVNENQDIAIVSNGTGVINIVGDFHIHRTADYDPDTPDTDGAVFAVKSDGQIVMKVPLQDVTAGALEIVGNDTGLFMPPNQTGIILHVTGNSGLVARNYLDANANYSLLVGRRYNGTQSAPTKVLAGEMFFRIAGQAATQSSTEPAIFQTFGPCQIDWVATEDQGPNNQGGELRFRATPNGSSAVAGITQVASINATTGVTATKFNGPLSGNVTGNLTGNVTGKADTAGNADTVTNGVYTNGSYANPSWITSLAASKVGLGNVENTALSTSTHYIGTTSIQYNRASGAQTLAGVSISGNAGTVTNGVYTTDTGTVSNTMLAGSIANNKLSNSAVTVNGTSIALGASATVTAAAGTLTGTTLNSTVVSSSLTSVGTLTNLAIASGGTITTPRVVINDGGIRTVSGGTTCTIDFAVDSIILWTAPSGTAAITLQNYTAGAQVKLIIAMTTSRDVTYGISAAANSSTGADNWNGAGAGSVDISNTAVHLEYTSITAVASGCYVKVTVN